MVAEIRLVEIAGDEPATTPVMLDGRGYVLKLQWMDENGDWHDVKREKNE